MWRRRSVGVANVPGAAGAARSVHSTEIVTLRVGLIVHVTAGVARNLVPACHVLSIVWLEREVPREGVVIHATFPLIVTD